MTLILLLSSQILVSGKILQNCGLALGNSSFAQLVLETLFQLGIAIGFNLENARISSLTDTYGEWNLELLHFLLIDLVSKIKAILPLSPLVGDDQRRWPSNNNNCFSISSAYNHLCGFANLISEFNWQLIGVFRPRRESVASSGLLLVTGY